MQIHNLSAIERIIYLSPLRKIKILLYGAGLAMKKGDD
jgi:hypothetical protein